jgi:hypothetical protein
MVSGMIVRIADEDVERDSGEQFVQRCRWVGEAVTNDLGQILVARISGHHLVEPEAQASETRATARSAVAARRIAMNSDFTTL